MHRKQNVEFYGFKSDQHSLLDFFFHFLSSPLHRLFLPNIFFLLLGIYSVVGFSLVGTFLGKLLGLGERASPCTSCLTIKTDNVTSGRRDVDPHG